MAQDAIFDRVGLEQPHKCSWAAALFHTNMSKKSTQHKKGSDKNSTHHELSVSGEDFLVYWCFVFLFHTDKALLESTLMSDQKFLSHESRLKGTDRQQYYTNRSFVHNSLVRPV